MNNFRFDINGLRAYAVVAVILFHFGVPGFNGGFIGVDLFFVISGFLMTGILLDSHSERAISSGTRFSLLGFYLARARRIVPALLIVCVVLLLLGWFLLSAFDYRMLATHTITALAFISNMKFWREAGYFDAASHEKWLLHTWSLSVEWQFYLLFPLVLMLLWKLWPNRRFIGIMLVAGLIVSFGLSAGLTPFKPGASFYLLPTRAWEMLAGAVVFFYASRLKPATWVSHLLEIMGFVLLLISLLLFDASTLWPGWQAGVPVLGTVLILLAAREASWLTSNALAQWLGKTSYSLYLWHWPFSVALIYLEWQQQFWPVIAALLLTLLLGWLSWWLVEQPVRRKLVKLSIWLQMFLIGSLVLVVALAALLIRQQDGLPSRLDPQAAAIYSEAYNKNPRRSECLVSGSRQVPECTYGGEQLGVIVIGDSHAGSVIRSVEKALPSEQLHVLDWSLSSCPTIFDLKDTEHRNIRCTSWVREAWQKSTVLDASVPLLIVNRISAYVEGPNEPDRTAEIAKPDRYITRPYAYRSAAFYQEMAQGMVDTACAFAAHRPVYMLRPIPELKLDVPRVMGRAAMRGIQRRVSISLEEYEARHRVVWAAQDRAATECGVILLDPRPYLCSDGHCWGDVDGLPIYYDDDHLNERGGQLLIPLFRQMFESSIEP